jgi:glycosyltransferase involved in cell wall biosynthesis
MSVRVALHGAVNNSAYGIARGLADAGTDVAFIRSRDTTLPIDQPVWQDSRFTLSTDEFSASGRWSWDRWTAFEQEVGWTPPPWLVDPATLASGPYAPSPAARPLLRRGLGALGRRRPCWSSVQQAWIDRELLVVSGSAPTLLAGGSGLPYVIWPHGSDARTALRDFGTHVKDVRGRAIAEAEAVLLRQAYRGARAVVTHDPLVVTGDARRSAALGRLAPVRFLAWPVEPSARTPSAQRRERLGSLLEELGSRAVDADVVALVASRIDYRLKGHDRLIEALTTLGDHGVHYLFVGWGADLLRARRALASAGLGERVSVLPRIMSKPVVRELYSAVDLTLDQFVYGTYGVAALESMAAGTPVVMAVDDPAFEARGWEAPPALRARSVDDIRTLLRRLGDGDIDMDDAAARGGAWIGRRHSPAQVQAQLESLVAELGSSTDRLPA